MQKLLYQAALASLLTIQRQLSTGFSLCSQCTLQRFSWKFSSLNKSKHAGNPAMSQRILKLVTSSLSYHTKLVLTDLFYLQRLSISA